MNAALDVTLGDADIGRLIQAPGGRLLFVYGDAWRHEPDAYPLSISMPMAKSEHTGQALEAYLWGLLPDNDIILDAWAKRFKVSARNPFALLSHVGEDCPGAVRFIRPERRRAMDRATDGKKGRGTVAWLGEHEIAERLRALSRDASAWRASSDAGQFSLGGAQPKTALYFDRGGALESDRGRWGVPSGRTPTTHIFKPGAPHLAGHAENEHFCLVLAREVGLPVADSRVHRFEDQVAVVVERYDRVRKGGAIIRVHQEDGCQALGVLPVNKYEADGGPGVKSIATLLRDRSRSAREDLDSFIGAIAFNWIIAGTDAHAKNYSVLIGRGGAVRLAPFYDIASFLPYAPHGLRKLKVAMKVGGKYRLHEIGAYQWGKLAAEVGRDAAVTRATVLAMCRALEEKVDGVLRASRKDGLAHPTLPVLAAKIAERAHLCAAALA